MKNWIKATLVLAGGSLAFALQSSVLQPEVLTPYPLPFTSQVPGDIDVQQLDAFNAQQQFDQSQRMFDIFAWQAFVGLNWPATADGQPDNTLNIGQKSDYGVVWEHWKHDYEVFTPDGQPPVLTSAQGKDTHTVQNTGNTMPDEIEEALQAFTGPLVDKNGNWVTYEIRMSPKEVDYVVNNNLYYVQGQVDFVNSGQTISFPAGVYNGDIGAIELKAAWRILDPKTDDPSRYFTTIGDININDPEQFSKPLVKKDVLLGLVGFHISAKTQYAKQWIWATFEHVDNLEVPPLTYNGQRLMPSFYNPNNQLLPVNTEPPLNAVIPGQPIPSGQYYNGWDPTLIYQPTQALRMIPIPTDKQQLNQQVQAALAQLVPGNVFQYYQLIDTQWPTDPSAPPTPTLPFDAGVFPNSITNKAGGMVTPTYLTNITMETYFQAGNEPAWHQIEGFPQSETTPIFGTESCTGCHSSAGVAIAYDPKKALSSTNPLYGVPLTGDFSWLLQQKAKIRQ